MRKHEHRRNPRAGTKVEKPKARVGPVGPHERLLRLQRLAGNAAVAKLLAPDRVVPRGGGRSLEPSVRQDMEAKLGHDFSGVRLHEDDAAARTLGAHAYTVGTDIVFASGKYDQRRLAHELVHVVQQAHGPVEGAEVAPGVTVSDPSDRHEKQADRVANRVVAGQSAEAEFTRPASSNGAPVPIGSSVQRQSVLPRFPMELLEPNFMQVPYFSSPGSISSSPGLPPWIEKLRKRFGIGGLPPVTKELSGMPTGTISPGQGAMFHLKLENE